ncbi:glycosyltransferase [Rhodococcus sp. IEGM 1401]|uniref:glycosyltransferase n=1 Tax=unclassified Rhodococcus (in: high G+C Gram-positive bacteria) TaxID=192944 RepID=UPI0022B4B20A|nr:MULTISPECIES: glycosyltransferase [unclassified Rhodococcus (in: high G+C Gram-positive bacteria)]MCZ4563306.1 glycosyltransferase [Rhodococcus sp. IEGM 1401]MDI9923408.1 glycosyltransferase [Rhodococcus sp. IEGM 1372]MDV8035896.1 glycosyltransferase [Rhodococcus sp. IEGM 1414]MDV8077175.1 glycosyltransferase [Rhodococcus sp. IEGM 1370]
MERRPTPPRVGTETDEFRAAALYDAINGLADRNPLASAAIAFVPWQKYTAIGAALLLLACGVFAPVGTLLAVTVVCTIGYLLAMIDRLLLFSRGLDASAIVTVTDEEARAVPDDRLPYYTILVPAYDEPEVVGDLIAAMTGLDYPADKLQVLLLLEEDDEVTIEAAARSGVSDSVDVVLVPAGDPRTKPKACNYGLHFATGTIVTIFDAEDLPERLQLRRVVAAFERLPDTVACVQAKLAFHNGSQNLLTGWFTADYALWFGYLLPGLMASTSPIPLGGTSNHLRRDVIDEVGAWDGFNVTEDADLGVRIAASGYSTAVLDSTTLEEANSDPINWVRQRSRWYKGYLQTWLVHMRRPVSTVRALGPVGTYRFTLLLAGTPITACINMVFWFNTAAWILGQPALVAELFPPYIYYFSLLSLVVGNIATVYMYLIASRESDNAYLLVPSLTMPLYWVMMSVAAIKGCWQLVRNPSYWEKTFHGLSGPAAPPVGEEQNT